jgi:hypothetical protein
VAKKDEKPGDLVVVSKKGYPNHTVSRRAFEKVWQSRGYNIDSDATEQAAPATVAAEPKSEPKKG